MKKSLGQFLSSQKQIDEQDTRGTITQSKTQVLVFVVWRFYTKESSIGIRFINIIYLSDRIV